MRALCRRKNANKNDVCKELFGNEPQEDARQGSIVIPDLTLFLSPVPSLEHGYLYVTTPYLIRRVFAVLVALKHAAEAVSDSNGCDKSIIDVLYSGIGNVIDTLRNNASNINGANVLAIGGAWSEGDEVTLGLTRYRVSVAISSKAFAELAALFPLLEKISEKGVIVLGDDVGSMVIEKGLIRLTRVRLKEDTKTVDSHGLWTEEYIPPGSVFMGALFYRSPGVRGKFRSAVLGGCEGYVVLGGNETVGKGLVKLVVG